MITNFNTYPAYKDSGVPVYENSMAKTKQNHGRSYFIYRSTTRKGSKVAVIWRETKGWTKEDHKRDAAFVAEHKLTEGADEILVNGGSVITGAQSLEGSFKVRMLSFLEV